MKAVNDGDVETLLNLYDNKAVLIPTFSNRLLNTADKLKDKIRPIITPKIEKIVDKLQLSSY